jgi:hypothetical protein
LIIEAEGINETEIPLVEVDALLVRSNSSTMVIADATSVDPTYSFDSVDASAGATRSVASFDITLTTVGSTFVETTTDGTLNSSVGAPVNTLGSTLLTTNSTLADTDSVIGGATTGVDATNATSVVTTIADTYFSQASSVDSIGAISLVDAVENANIVASVVSTSTDTITNSAESSCSGTLVIADFGTPVNTAIIDHNISAIGANDIVATATVTATVGTTGTSFVETSSAGTVSVECFPCAITTEFGVDVTTIAGGSIIDAVTTLENTTTNFDITTTAATTDTSSVDGTTTAGASIVETSIVGAGTASVDTTSNSIHADTTLDVVDNVDTAEANFAGAATTPTVIIFLFIFIK